VLRCTHLAARRRYSVLRRVPWFRRRHAWARSCRAHCRGRTVRALPIPHPMRVTASGCCCMLHILGAQQQAGSLPQQQQQQQQQQQRQRQQLWMCLCWQATAAVPKKPPAPAPAPSPRSRQAGLISRSERKITCRGQRFICKRPFDRVLVDKHSAKLGGHSSSKCGLPSARRPRDDHGEAAHRRHRRRLAAAATRAAVVPGLERASELLPYSRSSERLMRKPSILRR
jgi:hypothetical protein